MNRSDHKNTSVCILGVQLYLQTVLAGVIFLNVVVKMPNIYISQQWMEESAHLEMRVMQIFSPQKIFNLSRKWFFVSTSSQTFKKLLKLLQ